MCPGDSLANILRSCGLPAAGSVRTSGIGFLRAARSSANDSSGSSAVSRKKPDRKGTVREGSG